MPGSPSPSLRPSRPRGLAGHWVAVVLVACGGGEAPSPPASATAAQPLASIVAPPAGPDDVEVARVDGRPVWGSCVAAQVRRGAPDRRAALDECIAFELLAQAAERRGLARAPEVREATRTALVSAIVAREFEARHGTLDDLGPKYRQLLEQNLWRLDRPDIRASVYVRAKLPPEAPPADEAAAKAAIEDVARVLAPEPGLMLPSVEALVAPIEAARGVDLEVTEVPPAVRSKWVKEYGDALYGIAEVGRASAPVRTKWGWDVIVWTGGLPPRKITRDELAAEMFPELRRAYFVEWAEGLAKAAGVRITRDEALIGKLDEVVP